MSRRELLEDDEPDTKDAIRQAFKSLGGNVPMRVLAQSVIERGILGTDLLARCQLRAVQELCRSAVSRDTPEGVPLAQPTGDSEEHWKQLDLFSYAEAADLIERRAKGVADDYARLRRLHTWCLYKFGKAPEIPQLTELSEA